MQPTLSTIDEILAAAVEIASAEDRQAFVERACSNQPELRFEVERLAGLYFRAGSFLEQPAACLELEYTQAIGDADTHNDAAAQDLISLAFLAPPSEHGALGRIGHYEVESVIGRGGMGIVLKAHDTRLNRTVAVKVLAPDLAANDTAHKRFIREAQAAAAIAHASVVTIHAVDEARLPYIVMEFVDGISLREHLDRCDTLPPSEISRIGSQIAAALAAAHARGLIHRDIKPANILLEAATGRVKVTDFGLARAADDLDLTQTGEIAGTPQYMSPEQAQGLPLDIRSDFFSLGCVLYAMCTGRSPFSRADSAIAVIRRVCDEKHRPIRELNPEIPTWLCEITDRLLAKNPDDRFQTAREVADLLCSPHPPREEPVGNALRGIPHAATTARPANPKSRIPNQTFIATAAAAFILAALGVWVIIKDRHGKEIARVHAPEGASATIETNAQPKAAATPTAPPIPIVERQAFVLLGGPNVPERKFDTLSDAVLASSDGDTIEVRGNGPFITDPVTINLPLTIRSASGFRPVIRLNQTGVAARKSLLDPTAALTLEGLELGVSGGASEYYEPMIIGSRATAVNVVNSRLVLHGSRWMFSLDSISPVRLVNCELVGETCEMRIHTDAARRLELDNCIVAGVGLDIRWDARSARDVHVRVQRSTWVTHSNFGQIGLSLDVNNPRAFEVLNSQANSAVEIDLSATVNASAPHLVQFVEAEQHPAAEVLAFLGRFMKWRDTHNVYSPSVGFLDYSVQWKKGPTLIKDLTEWRQFCRATENRSVQGTVRFEGGDVLAKAAATPQKLAPIDFRLRRDSAGYRAGPDGKDLGADIELVGPGPAYERFQQTPAYQQWLSDVRRSSTDN